MIYDDANDIVDKRFKALLSRYENNLETTKIGSHFFFHSVLVLYCKCHKINFGGDGSYIGLLG